MKNEDLTLNYAKTFDPSVFRLLKKAEENYFWFKVRRKWIFDKIKKFIPPPAKLLEIGCGTGNVSSFLSQKGYLVTGCEFYPEAIDIAWRGFQIVEGDANSLSFKDNSFDIVGLFDVIEHFNDDISILREATRVVRKGGVISLTVPAKEELWSWFDEVSLHKRRYEKEILKKVLSEIHLRPLFISYMFMSLYLPIRFLRKRVKKYDELFKINRSVNIFFKTLFDIERIISKVLPLPIGTSLIAVARKDT